MTDEKPKHVDDTFLVPTPNSINNSCSDSFQATSSNNFNENPVNANQNGSTSIPEPPTEMQNQLHEVAPGEGKLPSNILKSKDWDTASFPCLYPDAKNGLHQEREVKLTDPDFFQQRILNFDRRFANNTEFIFAANAYLELRRFNLNINISFMRGKRRPDGQYSLDDAGYSCKLNINLSVRSNDKKDREFEICYIQPNLFKECSNKLGKIYFVSP